VRRAVSAQVHAANYANALQLIDEAKPLLSEVDVQSLTELTYDSWAKQRMAAKEWKKAASVYAEALMQTNSSSLLRNNSGFLTQEWAKDAYKRRARPGPGRDVLYAGAIPRHPKRFQQCQVRNT